VALFARRGLWGLVDARLNVRLFPVGYWLRLDGERPRSLLTLPRRGPSAGAAPAAGETPPAAGEAELAGGEAPRAATETPRAAQEVSD